MVAAETSHRHSVVTDSNPLAIVAGSGTLPFAVADAAIRRGRRVVMLALRGMADAARLATYPHHWIKFGQIARCARLARQEGCREIVFIGGIVRPAISQLWLDFGTLRHLPQLLKLLRAGDNGMLSGFTKAFEAQGFRVTGAHEIAPEILMPAGGVGRRAPSAIDWDDIRRGLALLDVIAPFDVGQAVVMAEGRVLAIEGAEGTDNVLIRLADLKAVGRVRWPAGRGVLVKAVKRGQDRRIDLPALGPRTIELVARAGLNGIAVTAGSAVVADADRIAGLADQAGIFVYGVDADAAER
jgi:DUF1009 family protein